METTSKTGIFCLTLNLCFYRIFTRLPGIFIKSNGSGAPLSALISALFALFLILLLLILYKKCGCHNVLSLAEKLTGVIGKRITGLIMVIFIVLSSAFALRDFSLLTSQLAYPSTPLYFISLFLILPPLLGTFSGRGLLSLHNLTVPVIFALLLLILILPMRWGQIDNFFPPLGDSFTSTVTSAFNSTLLFSDIVLLFMLNPFNNKGSQRSVFIATALGILTVLLTVISFTAISVYPESQDILFPIYKLAKTVWSGRFFQRTDGIFLIVSAFSVMLYLTFCLSLATDTAGHICSFKSISKIALFSVAILTFVCGVGRSFLSDYRLLRVLMFSSMAAVALTFIIFITAFLKGATKK